MTDALELFQKLSCTENLSDDYHKDSLKSRQLAEHKAWLKSIRHEIPNPARHYRVGIYIRYFNQTKHQNYLDYHIQQYRDTLSMCPNWDLVDIYVDEGPTAPNMETAPKLCQLLQDCFDGKVDLIITQKISNISKKDYEITYVSRLLASLKKPVGIYFISEDIFTLASYYQDDLKDTYFFPENWNSDQTALQLSDADEADDDDLDPCR